MARKKVPAIVFNNSNFIYPNGLRVNDEDELAEKLESGDWNTGPVDAKKGTGEAKAKKAELSDSEKRAEIARLNSELGKDDKTEDLGKTDPGKAIDPGKPDTAKTDSTKKPLSHMNITELVAEAEVIKLTVDENWTKTELYNAIKKKKG
jgi:hypothetical protein